MKNEVFCSIEKYIILAIFLVIAAITICGLHTDYRIAKAIEQGNDPILSRLAFSDDGCGERLLYIVDKGK